MLDTTVHEATFYVQIQKRRQTWRNGAWHTVSAIRMTTEPPKQLATEAIAVKLTVRIPDAAFKPIEPSAVIEIPDSLVQHTIEVVVGDANGDGES